MRSRTCRYFSTLKFQDDPLGTSRPYVKSYDTSHRPIVVPSNHVGIELLHDPLYNKGTGFPQRERDRLKIRGLVPPCELTMEQQLKRVYASFQQAGDAVAKHIFLTNLQDRNESLFYRLLVDHIEEMAPIVYTPVIGYACKNMGNMFRRARGLYLDAFRDRGDLLSVVRNWPEKEVDVCVMTDGSRILGLGDLGVHGAGIPIGKLSLYVAGGGLDPTRCLPITIDVGTNNEELLRDDLYLGTRKKRITGPAYFEFMDEVMRALSVTFPKAMIQFEDFKTPFAEALLDRYRYHHRVFNDDLQGTGTMVLAGILSALRVLNLPTSEIKNQKIVCLGAGGAGLGVCRALVQGMIQEGATHKEALSNFWLVDDLGLLTSERMANGTIRFGQHQFARTPMEDLPEGLPLVDVVDRVKPTILLGLCGVGGTFTKEVLENMTKHCQRPIVFALSNPTHCSECTAEQAYMYTHGRAVFASGSPFPPVVDSQNRVVFTPTQANNMFIFPGIGLGVSCAQARHVSDSMLYAAAVTLSACVPAEDIARGRVFPAISSIRDVSRRIAIRVAEVAEQEGLNDVELDKKPTMTESENEGEEEVKSDFKSSWEEVVMHKMWEPQYRALIPSN